MKIISYGWISHLHFDNEQPIHSTRAICAMHSNIEWGYGASRSTKFCVLHATQNYIYSKYNVLLSSQRRSVSLTQKVYQIISKFWFIMLIKSFIWKSCGMQQFKVFWIFYGEGGRVRLWCNNLERERGEGEWGYGATISGASRNINLSRVSCSYLKFKSPNCWTRSQY
jgi:hypothetical protein